MKSKINLLIWTIIINFSSYAQQAKQGSMVLIHSKNQSFIIGMSSSDIVPGEPAQGFAYYMGKHKVSFTYDFYMDTTLVTQKSYNKIMGNNPSYFKTGNLDLPVEQVNWFDAVLYCNEKSKLENLEPAYTYTSVTRNGNHAVNIVDLKFDIKKNGYRLPTNAEYEYAERANTTGNYFFSSNGQNLTALGNPYAWSTFNSNKTTHPVATKKPNPFGLYDIVGNIFAWCYDWDNPYVLTDEVDPIGKSTGTNKIAKGGHYDTDIQLHMRIQYHTKLVTTFNDSKVGLRTVRTVVPCAAIPLIPKYKINGGNLVSGSQISAKVGDAITLHPELSSAGTWQWQGPVSFSSSSQEVNLVNVQVKQEGKYKVQFKNSIGCSGNSEYTIQLSSITGLEGNSNLLDAGMIYPNPFSNSFTIKTDQKFEYSILSMDGQMMEQGNEMKKVNIGGNLSIGNYILKIKSEGKPYTMKIEKQ